MKLAPVLVLVTAWLHAQDATVVRGSQWKLEDGRKLGTAGTEVKSVRPGTPISGTNASTPLMLACGSNWVVHTCSAPTCKANACESGNSFRPWEWAKSTPDGFLRSLLKREPQSAVRAGARDNLEGADALLARNGDAVQFAPALRRIPEGAYCLQLSALPKGTSPQHRTTLTWRRDPQGAASLPELIPGLYALDVARLGANGSCQFDSSNDAPAWVLVAQPAQYERWKAEWDSFTANLRKLESDTDPEVAGNIRHALMAAMADSIQ